MIIPNIWKNEKYSKPPTSHGDFPVRKSSQAVTSPEVRDGGFDWNLIPPPNTQHHRLGVGDQDVSIRAKPWS